MALIQWRDLDQPLRELQELQERVSRLFDFERGSPVAAERGTSTFPPVDIRHDADNVYVFAEVPGVALGDLDLSITGETLAIKGERKAPEAAEERFHRRERAYGHFNRLLGLPDRVDAERIRAALKDGILRITLPKSEAAKPQQIKVAQS